MCCVCSVQLAAPKQAIFKSCSFMGNQASNGGAVVINGAQKVNFKDCR